MLFPLFAGFRYSRNCVLLTSIALCACFVRVIFSRRSRYWRYSRYIVVHRGISWYSAVYRGISLYSLCSILKFACYVFIIYSPCIRNVFVIYARSMINSLDLSPSGERREPTHPIGGRPTRWWKGCTNSMMAGRLESEIDTQAECVGIWLTCGSP